MTPLRPILDSDEQALKNRLDEMYERVSNALDRSLDSLLKHDAGIATEVIKEDNQINALQQKIEELGIQYIALQQPVASDLRKLMTDIFISMELERIADHAKAISRIVLKFEAKPNEQFINPVADMAEKCQSMMKLAMRAYDELDESLARSVAAMDDEIDDAEQAVDDFMVQEICSKPENKITCTYLLWVAHNLERIGDRITNIAERVVYMATNVKPDLNR